MSNNVEYSPFRGMRDLLPEEVVRRDQLIQTITQTYRQFGFNRIETPAIERLEVLVGSHGGENEKLIFQILKRGEKGKQAEKSGESLADGGLRFDLTVPLARYYAANQSSLPVPFKAMQIAPVWRAERPQKGRYRQFTQCDLDIIGLAAPAAEIDLILATGSCLSEIGLKDFTVRLNDRRLLTELCRAIGVAEENTSDALIALDKLDKIGKEGVLEQLQPLASDIEKVRAMLDAATASKVDLRRFVQDFGLNVDDKVLDEMELVTQTVRALNHAQWNIEFDPTLVRGMGYYTGMVFEVSHPAFSFSLAGGGRYDKMIGRFLGKDVPACGFSIGFERLVLALSEGEQASKADNERAAVLYDALNGAEAAYQAAAELRRQAGSVTVLPTDKRVGRQIERLRATGITKIYFSTPGQALRLAD